MLVACVAGARPNFMKVKPVIDGLEMLGVGVELIHSGQHYDVGMSQIFFDELGLRAPDHHLGVGGGTHAEQTARVMIAIEPVLEKLQPDLVLVVGDVNSTVAAALVAAKVGIRVAHVEAGLRSRDWAMPEEINRVVTDSVSDYLLAPSADAVENLRAEGYDESQIRLVGNTMVDSVVDNIDRARARPVLHSLGLRAGEYGLLTLHRPANVDEPDTLRVILDAVGTISNDVPFLFPAHPRTYERLRALTVPDGITVTAPLGYLDFLALEAAARLVLTDSGGVQEETTVLGVPCLTLRDNTERPITVTEGTNTLVGRDPVRIEAEARRVLRDGVPARKPPLWDGHAGRRVAAAIVGAPPSRTRRGAMFVSKVAEPGR
jgi:UDP-N-acetylglucosamine 2-epimerase (non-hydrolysing)